MATVAQQKRIKSTRLGKAKWTDPERRQSIKDDTRVKMEWRFKLPLHTKNCWIPLVPAQPCLLEAMEQIERLLRERNRDIWDGESTTPGCSWDVSMHGRSVNDAQPTIIFSSLSKICRRNAKNIITNEDIAVDPRGIGMEYYSTGPDFFAGSQDIGEELDSEISNLFPDVLTNLPSSSKPSVKSSSSPNRSTGSQERTPRHQSSTCKVNGSLISVQSTNCTLGGLISIDGELYGLTVAHAFEKDGILNSEPHPTPAPVIERHNVGTIGSLLEKRYVPIAAPEGQRDLDWALCLLDRTKVHLTNDVCLPDGTTLYPTQIALQNPLDADVWIHSGTTGLVKGFLTGDYSLVALPGSRTFQRMWIVVLDRLVRSGDCGSWVIDSINGTWYGQIVAAKPETTVAYIVLARDIFRDIRDQFGGRHVRMPIESDFVNEVISMVKRDLSQSSSTAQGSSQEEITRSGISSQGRERDVLPSKRATFRPGKLIRQFTNGSFLAQESPTTSIEMRSSMQTSVRETFQKIIFQDIIEEGIVEHGREWYMRYLETCFREHFKSHLYPTLPGLTQTTLNVSPIGPENNKVVYEFLAALARRLLSYERNMALCTIVDDLRNNNCDFLSQDDGQMNIYELVVIAIGWLSMSMPYPIMHPNDGSKYEGRGVFVNRQDLEGAYDRPLSTLLGKFSLFESMLDPPPIYKAYGQTHTSQYFMISTVCFYTLRQAKIEIQWTEQLPLHLKFDAKRRALKLFAFPSFARMLCRGKSNTILAQIMDDFYSVNNNSSSIIPPRFPFAEDLCREILLSYRLIFGLDSSSYRLFNRECASEMRLSSDFDPLLAVLCGGRWDSVSSKPIFEEIGADPPASFYLTSDFPVFGKTLYELHDFVQRQHPSSIRTLWSFRTLWNDQRDMTRWISTWAIFLIGGGLLFLGLLQLIFQIWQVILAQQQLATEI